MFEYHGWITLRSAAEAVDDEPPLRLTEIQALADELAGYALVDLRQMNGWYYIHLGGCPNHRGAHGPALIDLFAKVGRDEPSLAMSVSHGARTGQALPGLELPVRRTGPSRHVRRVIAADSADRI
ncbi:Imm7 family immunity protein [Micromonospora sp. WMMD812]|uniref:Imm7 family immunity protein n=1 Tax=Micromonospora sp. WMMD812 TaxID=3015152 RepID=UPI00248CFB0A|nr:Imm7 family immunity protein [Micromonospora sp. WMMD812]WBB69139.1 Imm7 family immunity protein [Micromonospora sp. WMMD812]